MKQPATPSGGKKRALTTKKKGGDSVRKVIRGGRLILRLGGGNPHPSVSEDNGEKKGAPPTPTHREKKTHILHLKGLNVWGTGKKRLARKGKSRSKGSQRCTRRKSSFTH